MNDDAMGQQHSFGSAAEGGYTADTQSVRTNSFREIKINTYNIHDILHGDGSCPVTLGTLQHLIRSQASLHMADIVDDQKRLKNLLDSRINSIRGFVMHAEGVGPVAYSIYYPMIDRKGQRVAYCEDFFIVESFRGYGVAKLLFHELAKRTRDDNAEYLQWSTDKRNNPVHSFVTKLGAKHPNIVTIAASDLLGDRPTPKTMLTEGWSQANFVTRALEPNDMHELPKVGLEEKFIRNTGDMKFKGFITHERGTGRVVAVTPGWIHTSTFQLKEGIHLEDPVFADVDETQKAAVLLSVIEATKHMAGPKEKPRYNYLRWHVTEDNSFMNEVLQNKYDLPRDSMLGTPESELIVYTLENGELKKLANNVPDMVIRVSNTDPIGNSRRTDSNINVPQPNGAVA